MKTEIEIDRLESIAARYDLLLSDELINFANAVIDEWMNLNTVENDVSQTVNT